MDYKKLHESRTFWMDRINSELIPVSVPYDYEEQVESKHSSYEITLPQELSDKLIKMSKNNNISLYIILLTCFKIVLHKYNNITNIAVGSPLYKDLDNKEHQDRLIPIIEELALEGKFQDYLSNVKKSVVESYDNQRYPLSMLAQDIFEDDSAVEGQFFKTLCMFEEIHDTNIVNDSWIDLSAVFEKRENSILLNVNYNVSLYRQETIVQFVDRFCFVVDQVTKDPTVAIRNITLLTNSEKEQILQSFSYLNNNEPCNMLLCEILQEQINKTPDRVAIEFNGQQITYREFDERSNRLAWLLRSKGVDRNVLVGVICNRSIETIVGILAVFKAGGAYIPIDPSYPMKRIIGILEDSQVNTIITEATIIETLNNFYYELVRSTKVQHIVLMDKNEYLNKQRNIFQTYALAYSTEIGTYKVEDLQCGLEIENNHLDGQTLEKRVNKLVQCINNAGLEGEKFALRALNPINRIVGTLALTQAKIPFVDISMINDQETWKDKISENAIKVVLTESSFLEEVDRVFWATESIRSYLLLDEYEVSHSEKEKDFKLLWNAVAEESTANMNDYGWSNSYNGEAFSISEMNEYVENFRFKLQPFINEQTRVLEIGCGHGLVISEISNQVAYYHATDLSETIIEKNRLWVNENVVLDAMPAYQIDSFRGKEFDLVICSSVVHYFPNTVYLEEVINGAIESLGDKGIIYLDDLLDMRKKQELENSVIEYKKMYPDDRTKMDWSRDLFVDDDFFTMLEGKYSSITGWERTNKRGEIQNELTRFRFDVIIYIDKLATMNEKKITPKVRFYNEEIYLNEPKIIPMENAQSKDFNINFSVEDTISQQSYPSSPIKLVNESTDLCYVIYTSGTTGKPKGAMVEHLGMVNHLLAKINDLNISGETKIVQNASLSFDISVWQIFASLLVGGCVYIYPNALVRDTIRFLKQADKDNISILQVVPSYLSAMLDCLEQERLPFKSLRYLIATGEELKKHYVARWFQLYPTIKMVNAYGPTEASDDITHYIFDRTPDSSRIPVGRAVQNFNIFILDDDNQLTPIGLPGQICVSGIGVGRGYLNNRELTEASFTDNPFSEMVTRMYRTGDLGRWLTDGNIEYIDRMDNQVKVRGFRIELGEIENKLLECSSVDKAVVIDKRNLNGDKYLCAYITCQGLSDLERIKEQLSTLLPEYMIPSYFVLLDEIPLTLNGKIDRKMLPEPYREFDDSLPRSEIEKDIATVWKDVMGIQKDVGIHMNFFELGGDSIKAIQIAARLQKYNLRVDIQGIFKNPTIAELSNNVEYITNKSAQGQTIGYIPLTPIQREFYDTVMIDKHHYNQSVILFRQDGVQEDKLKEVFQKILVHHDALRSTFSQTENKIVQMNKEMSDLEWSIDLFNLHGVHNVHDVIKEKADILQGEIDLIKGPLIKLAIFKTEDGDFLFITIHHLVIDGISWRIILEDIATLYNQSINAQLLSLPLKSDSYKSWSEGLSGYSSSQTLLDELIFWGNMEEELYQPLPKDYQIVDDLVKDSVKVSFKLSVDETKRLLTIAPVAYRTEINVVLLSVLGISMNKWTGYEKFPVALEGHGRENILNGKDFSRTVGWFTSVFPIVLTADNNNLISDIIKNTKNLMKEIPNKGIGYGILKYLTPDELKTGFKFTLKPEIGFNYLGQIDTTETGGFELSNLTSNNNISPNSNRENVLSINSMVMDGRFEVIVDYHSQMYSSSTIDNFIGIFKNELVRMIEQCTDQAADISIASDFSDPDLDDIDVEDFLSSLNN